MTARSLAISLAIPFAGALALQGCAATPKPTAPAAATRPASPAIVTMAPIPNPEPEHRTRSPRSGPPSRHAPSPEAKTALPPAAVKPGAPSPIVEDHARATRLRAQGLEQLNRGAIDRAVALLQSAAKLDPGNTLIQRDLERAIRISRAVHTRH